MIPNMIRILSGRLPGLALALLALSLVPTTRVQAQGFDPEQMRLRMTEQVGETIAALELEGETADTVRGILLARVEKRMKLFAEMRSGQGPGREGMREAFGKIDEETGTQLAEVLTAEQVAAWKAREEEIRSRMRRGPGN